MTHKGGVMAIREEKGKHRTHCDRCTLGALRSGDDDGEATKLAEEEGFQKWAGPGSPWKWLCPWCVWEVGLSDEAHEIIEQMLETLALKGGVVALGYSVGQLAWMIAKCRELGFEPPEEEPA